MTKPTTPAAPDSAAGAPAAAKPKAPRRESTKVAAAMKIAATHPHPAELLKLLGDLANATAHKAANDREIEKLEAALAAKRSDYRARSEFVTEVEGLDATTLVGVRAVLESRAPKTPAV